MKATLRIFALVLVALFTSLSTARGTDGTCWILCQDMNTGEFFDVFYPATYDDCCYGPSPCPAGSLTVGRAWSDPMSGFDFCRPI